MGREWTISDVSEHYDYNAATMLAPKNEDFNFDFDFKNYIHVLYETDNFINLEAEATAGIKSWKFTEGGTTARALARTGGGGGVGYSFVSQPHVCFCEGNPYKHIEFTGTRSTHRVCPSTQEQSDRAQATDFFSSIKEGTPLVSKDDLDDSTSGNEPLWELTRPW